jgi:hypothetical protein
LTTLLGTHTLPTGLQKTQKIFNYKGGEVYKIHYYNGFYKTCEITIKPDTVQSRIIIQSDSGLTAFLNLFATSLINEVYYYETNIYVSNNGIIMSNFNNQSGGSYQFNRDTIANAYQFTVQKIS